MANGNTRSAAGAVLLGLLAIAIVMLAPRPAEANVVNVYDVVGSFQDGLSLSGTLNIDVTSGLPTVANVTTGPSPAANFTYVNPPQIFFSSNSIEIQLQPSSSSSSPFLSLWLPVTSLVNLPNAVSLTTNTTLYGATYTTILKSGSINNSVSPPSATPVPSSLPLFCTGLACLGLVACSWKKKAKVATV